MEAFQNNPVGAPYDIRFEKIYEKMADVATSEAKSDTEVESKQVDEQKTEAESKMESSTTVEEPKKEEPKPEEPKKEESKPEEPKKEEPVQTESNTLMYIGLAILVGVFLVWVFRTYSGTSVEESVPLMTTETPDYSLETPTETLYETSEVPQVGGGLSNLKFIKF